MVFRKMEIAHWRRPWLWQKTKVGQPFRSLATVDGPLLLGWQLVAGTAPPCCTDVCGCTAWPKMPLACFWRVQVITLQHHLLNPLHVAAITSTAEATTLHASSSFSFKVILSGGNEIAFRFEDQRTAEDELSRISQLVDQASTRR